MPASNDPRLLRRLDWRDPEMPAVRDYLDEDTGELKVELVRPEDVTTVAKEDLIDLPVPKWSRDPSYFWGEGKRKRKARRFR
jgi:hypothetical protein